MSAAKVLPLQNGMEPEVNVKRAILTQKRDQLKAQGYEHAVNAELAELLGDKAGAEDSGKKSKQCYAAARKCAAMLAELPPEPEAEKSE